MTEIALQKAQSSLLRHLSVPIDALRDSYVRQFLTCGKSNCRCRRGNKHGPFHYLVQCGADGQVRKFLLKTSEQRQAACAGIAAYKKFQTRLNALSRINAALLYRQNFSHS